MKGKINKQHFIGVFGLAMLNVAAVMSLRGLPMMAKEGLSMIFYILFSSVLFSLLTGAHLAGFVGVLISLPLAAILGVIMRFYFFKVINKSN